jgi:hypothetical protein
MSAGPGATQSSCVAVEGEWSLIFFSGEFSHAVIKIPRAGDFRVQHDFAGSEETAEAPREIRERPPARLPRPIRHRSTPASMASKAAADFC